MRSVDSKRTCVIVESFAAFAIPDSCSLLTPQPTALSFTPSAAAAFDAAKDASASFAPPLPGGGIRDNDTNRPPTNNAQLFWQADGGAFTAAWPWRGDRGEGRPPVSGGGPCAAAEWVWEAAAGPGGEDPFRADWAGWADCAGAGCAGLRVGRTGHTAV